MKYSVLTLGCRVNQADSFAFEADLRARGATAVPPREADLIIVNTCSVTGAADQGARHVIRRIARRNAGARIVVTGCYATRQAADLDGLPGVVKVVANDAKRDLVAMLDRERLLTTGDRFSGGHGEGACGAGVEPGVMGRTAYPLRVQTGCDEACAFCIVPATRGRSRSRRVREVLEEVASARDSGFKEVWLVGVHLGSYGRDLAGRATLLDLLYALDRVPGDLTFRLGSLEPMDCPPRLIDLVAGSGRVVPHFHLPLQHAADRVLRAMRRPYTFGQYRDLVAHIRARLPDASIGTDLIAGFPGEEAAEFRVAAQAVAELPLSYAHVFPYSDRPGTPASCVTPKVRDGEVRARAKVLREIGRGLTEAFFRSQIGTERPGLTIDTGTTVLTDNFLKVRIAPGRTRNERVRVHIARSQPALSGTIVPDS